MVRTRSVAGALLAAAATAAVAQGGSVPTDPEPASDRYAIQARLESRPNESSDGRYAVQGTARLAPTTSSESRYVLKSTAATCNPQDIFANGFE